MSSINSKGPGGGLPPPTPTTAQAEQMAKNAAAGASAPRPAGRSEAPPAAEREAPPVAGKRASAAETERAMGQSGFQRVGQKRRRGFELEDATEAPIPLPRDEVDASTWDQKNLNEAQQELTLQAAQLKQLAQEVAGQAPGDVGFFRRLVEHGFAPTEDDVAALEGLEKAPPPPPVDLAQVHQTLAQQFALTTQQLEPGAAMVAASLVVAGLQPAVQPGAEGLEPTALGRGMQQLVESSNEAVRDARQRHDGIDRQLARSRSFLPKR